MQWPEQQLHLSELPAVLNGCGPLAVITAAATAFKRVVHVAFPEAMTPHVEVHPNLPGVVAVKSCGPDGKISTLFTQSGLQAALLRPKLSVHLLPSTLDCLVFSSAVGQGNSLGENGSAGELMPLAGMQDLWYRRRTSTLFHFADVMSC